MHFKTTERFGIETINKTQMHEDKTIIQQNSLSKHMNRLKITRKNQLKLKEMKNHFLIWWMNTESSRCA